MPDNETVNSTPETEADCPTAGHASDPWPPGPGSARPAADPAPPTPGSGPPLKWRNSRDRLSSIYRSMMSRCYKPACRRFGDYGGRGIRVAPAWHDREAFIDWAMDSGYDDRLTLERFDVDGHYGPENCGWVTRAAQAGNRRDTVRLDAYGQVKNLRAWSEDPRCAVSLTALRRRVGRGWPAERAVSEPPGLGRRTQRPRPAPAQSAAAWPPRTVPGRVDA